ncbi:hypothetical protein C900_00376 [Fulvivirga imtechensis AK7]|uniref:Uncharacterized protein n=1 Tax=Fulvivirga imtechensis AK7 TaxID=1237149 RepID=L8JI08_9BACT|nr:hypothetical protein C900_00376 [Fulvivirga imtechensis AK7]
MISRQRLVSFHKRSGFGVKESENISENRKNGYDQPKKQKS